jgi:hypothetical protein
MTTADRLAAPRQVLPPGGDGGPPRPQGPSLRRRVLTLLIVVLLVGIPAGYLVISAEQSRASGKDKEVRAAAVGLTHEWPSRVNRRIYDVPIPRHSTHVAWFEINSWKTSKLYVQFATSRKGLNRFLHRIGASRSALREGRITVSAKEAATVGWELGSGRDWAGMVKKQPGPQALQHITVDLGDKARPKVYVVSTLTP